MILSILYNLLRCYSVTLNPQITNEKETTKHMFMVRYKNYTMHLVKLVKEITGIKLSALEKALS